MSASDFGHRHVAVCLPPPARCVVLTVYCTNEGEIAKRTACAAAIRAAPGIRIHAVRPDGAGGWDVICYDEQTEYEATLRRGLSPDVDVSEPWDAESEEES